MQEAHYSMWSPIFPTYIQMVIATVIFPVASDGTLDARVLCQLIVVVVVANAIAILLVIMASLIRIVV